MNQEPPQQRMKPVIILPIGTMKKKDIQQLRENLFCVVEAKKPEDIRFMEPPPQGYSAQEKAAMALCRFVVAQRTDKILYAGHLKEFLCDVLINGSPLQAQPVSPVAPVKPNTARP